MKAKQTNISDRTFSIISKIDHNSVWAQIGLNRPSVTTTNTKHLQLSTLLNTVKWPTTTLWAFCLSWRTEQWLLWLQHTAKLITLFVYSNYDNTTRIEIRPIGMWLKMTTPTIEPNQSRLSAYGTGQQQTQITKHLTNAIKQKENIRFVIFCSLTVWLNSPAQPTQAHHHHHRHVALCWIWGSHKWRRRTHTHTDTHGHILETSQNWLVAFSRSINQKKKKKERIGLFESVCLSNRTTFWKVFNSVVGPPPPLHQKKRISQQLLVTNLSVLTVMFGEWRTLQIKL